jgi:type II secretory pathway pseudopilin PulG
MRLCRWRLGAQRAGDQQGAYTIFFVAVLGLLTLLAVRSMTTSTVNSVRLTSNTHNATEGFLAAEEAMAQGMEWLASSNNSYTTHLWPSAPHTVGTPLSFPVVNMGGQTTSRAYTLSFGFEAGPPGESLLKVIGRAASSTGQGATVSQWVSLNTLLQTTALDAPLVVAGCLNVVSGVPDIYADLVPHNDTLDYITYYRGPTRRTALNGTAGSPCDEGTGSQPEEGAAEAPESIWRLNSHLVGAQDGRFANSAEPIGLSQYSGGDLWPRIFTESRDWFDDLRVNQPNALADMNIYYWDGAAPAPGSAPDTGQTWPSTIQKRSNGSTLWPNNTATFDYDGAPQPGDTFSAWGTFANPAVIIYRGAGCPNLRFQSSGSYIIIGVLYIEGASNPENAALACTADEWQRFMMLGTLVINGDLKILKKNPEIISAEVGGIYDTKLFPVTGVYGTAGTWKVQEN